MELCSDLSSGGVTPSGGAIGVARRAISIALHVMIRPRSGDFCYSDDEFQVMQHDIATAKQLGADGVVLGILDLDGRIDTRRTRQLVDLAAPLKVTYHRAFDMSRDLFASLQDLHSTGVHCVLTSGGKQTAIEGTETLKKLVAASNGISIMAGAGVEDHNVSALIKRTGVRAIHASLKSLVSSPMHYQNDQISMGDAEGREYQQFVVQQQKVERLLRAAAGEHLEARPC